MLPQKPTSKQPKILDAAHVILIFLEKLRFVKEFLKPLKDLETVCQLGNTAG